ncbi:hypothetical protein ACFVTY_09170 [Streptomyces sp. NPDC058067]|uniref:hypothetical protein n=1 Tax=Streptomyces sp. NPDC058067 TaxID=3346324 RepID=UPI0036EB53D6
MDASVAAVVGAAIGSLGGLGGAWLSVLGQGRQQRRQREAERERWRDEMRRESYNACIAGAKQLSAAWWKFSDCAWNEHSTPEDWRAAFADAHDAWTQFSTAVAAVTVAGPKPVADAADELRSAMYDLEVEGMRWFSAALHEESGRLTAHDQRFKRVAEAKREPDHAFQHAARVALGTELP